MADDEALLDDDATERARRSMLRSEGERPDADDIAAQAAPPDDPDPSARR